MEDSMEELGSLARKDVFILGAGFSKAVADDFPLAAELCDPILERLGDLLSSSVQPHGGESFEQWLSRLAEDQPHLSADENLERSVAFLRVSRAIGEILTERESSVLQEPMPEWLAKLLFAWHVRNATVISFNYDNLIECGVNSQHLPMYDRRPVRTHDILNRLPPLPPSRQSEETRVSNIQGGGRVAMNGNYSEQTDPWTDTFRLIKLHGSISWYWVPDDATGTTLQRWPDVGSFGQPTGDQRAKISRQLPGRELFIAPPSSTKSRYLANPVIRQLWRDALHALREADRVFFLGYSIPLQDQAAMSLIIEGIGERKPQIHIVDIHAGTVRDNLANLLISYNSCPGEGKESVLGKKVGRLKRRYRLKLPTGDNSIKDLADSYVDELATELAGNLTAYAHSQPAIQEVIEVDCTDPRFKTYPVVGDIFAMNGRNPEAMDFDGITVENGIMAIPCRIENLPGDNLALTKLLRHLQEKENDVRNIVLQLPKDNEDEPYKIAPIAVYRLETNKEPALHPSWHSLHLTPFIVQAPGAPPNYSGMENIN
jgi:hypothetical protein